MKGCVISVLWECEKENGRKWVCVRKEGLLSKSLLLFFDEVFKHATTQNAAITHPFTGLRVFFFDGLYFHSTFKITKRFPGCIYFF